MDRILGAWGPDRTRALLEGTESPVEAMVEAASRLEGASFAVIPCNTAHAFLEAVRRRVSVPFLDMIRVTAERAVERVGERGCVGLLAASGTIHSGIYRKGVEALAPRARVVTLFDLDDGEALQSEAVRKLADAGASLVLTACSEIPLVLGRERVGETPLVDPMEVAAEEAVAIALGRKPLPCTS